MRANVNRKTLAAGIGAAGLLGLGLAVAVPAFADDPSPSASPKPSATSSHDHKRGWHEDGRRDGQRGKQRPFRHRLRFAARGVHGEATVKQKDGSFHVTAWQRGQVTGVSGMTVTIRSADGVTWTWTTNDKTRVRKNGEKSKVSALSSGDEIIARGERAGTARTATLIFVPEKR